MNEVEVSFSRLADAGPPYLGPEGLIHLRAYARSNDGHLIKIGIAPQTPKLIRTGIRLYLPSGMVGFILTRAADAVRGLNVVNGPVAFNHNDELKFVMQNNGSETAWVTHGDLIVSVLLIHSSKPVLSEKL